MKHIIKGMVAEKGRTCMLSSMRAVIRFWNKERLIDESIDESMVLGLAAGFQFRYGHYQNEKVKAKIKFGLPDIACFHITLDKKGFKKLFNLYGLDFIELENSQRQAMINNLKQEIKNNRPVIITVSNKFLDYIPPQLRQDIGRYIVCYGWDDVEENVWVLDQFIGAQIPTYYNGKFLLKNFLKAINLEAVKLDQDYTSWNFHRLDQYHKTDLVQAIRQFIIQSIIESCHLYLTGKLETFYYASTRVDYASGFNGIKLFIQDLEKISQGTIDHDIKKWLLEVYSLITTFAGPVTAYSLYAQYLEWAARHYKLMIDEQLINDIRSVAQQWHIIANVLYKAYSFSDIDSIKRVITRTNNLLTIKHSLIHKLRETAAKNQ